MSYKTGIIIFCAIAGGLFVFGSYFYAYMPDETFVTLRYARNVLDGKGFVFNEGERVEGYTSHLWLFFITLAGRAGLPLIAAARWLGSLLTAGTILLSALAALQIAPLDRETGRPRLLGVMMPPVLLAASAPVLVYSLAGTEMPLYAFLLLLGFVLLKRGSAPATLVVFAALGLTRPEGLVLYMLAWILLVSRAEHPLRAIGSGAAVLVVVYAPLLAWKIRYFGSLLPSSLHASIGPLPMMLRNGSSYLFGFVLSYGYFIAVGLLLGRGGAVRFGTVGTPLVFIAAQWAGVWLLGGDWSPHYKTLLPSLPLVMLVTAHGLAVSQETGRRSESRVPDAEDRDGNGHGIPVSGVCEENAGSRARHHPAHAVAVILVFLVLVPGGLRYDRFELERTVVRHNALLGIRLREILPLETTLCCGSTGAIGYYTGMPVIDLLGRTEPQIARHGRVVASQPGHMKTDGKHVLSRKPDLLLLGNIQIHRGMRDMSKMKHKIQEMDIIEQPEFFEDYEFVNIPLKKGFYLSCYKRKSYFLPL